MNNQTKFTETLIKADELAKVTGNKYRVLSTRPYEGKNDLPNGITMELLIMEDHAPAGYYGMKKDGSPREGVIYQNLTVTIANGEKDKMMKEIHAGDEIALYDLDQDHSYFINYELILRFRKYKKINEKDNHENNKNDH